MPYLATGIMTPQLYTSSVSSNVHFVHFVSDLYLKIYAFFCTLYLSFNCLGYQLFISLIVSYNIFSSTFRRHASLYLYPVSVINKYVFFNITGFVARRTLLGE